MTVAIQACRPSARRKAFPPGINGEGKARGWSTVAFVAAGGRTSLPRGPEGPRIRMPYIKGTQTKPYCQPPQTSVGKPWPVRDTHNNVERVAIPSGPRGSLQSTRPPFPLKTMTQLPPAQPRTATRRHFDSATKHLPAFGYLREAHDTSLEVSFFQLLLFLMDIEFMVPIKPYNTPPTPLRARPRPGRWSRGATRRSCMDGASLRSRPSPSPSSCPGHASQQKPSGADAFKSLIL